MHENGNIGENNLSWTAVFEWAKLISEGSGVYVAGELPDSVLALALEDAEHAHRTLMCYLLF